jgi:hypothetical protein
MLTMNFPFSISPELITGNAMYSIEAYNSILEQLSRGVAIFSDINGVGDVVGISTGYSNNQVSVSIGDYKFIKYLKANEKDLCITTFIEADADTGEDGVQVAKSAKVHYLVILLKSELQELMASVGEDAVIAKEVTLEL